MKTKLPVLTALTAGVILASFPGSATAEQPQVDVFNNYQSGPLHYRNCGYRVQAGYYGNVTYLQLKARNTSCRISGLDSPDTTSGRPYGSYAEVDTLFPGNPSPPTVTIKRATKSGVTTTQATGPAGGRFMQGAYSAADAAYRICSTSSTGNKCDTGTVDVYPFR